MKRRKSVLGMLSLAMLLGGSLAVFGPAGPASANTGDSVEATANGTVTTTAAADCSDITGGLTPAIDVVESPCTGGGDFVGLALAGTFTEGFDGTPGAPSVPTNVGVFTGQICLPPLGTVPFTTTQTLLRGSGTISPAAFNDSNCAFPLGASVSTGGGVPVTCVSSAIASCFEGAILDGDFVRVGATALVGMELGFNIEGPLDATGVPPTTGGTDPVAGCADGSEEPADAPACRGHVFANFVGQAIPNPVTGVTTVAGGVVGF